MLMVGHTHEDIDQFFSIPSKYFRVLPDQLVRDIQEFFRHCKASMKSGQHLKMDYMHACFDYKGFVTADVKHAPCDKLGRANAPCNLTLVMFVGWSINDPVNDCYNSSIEGIATASTAGYATWEKPKIFRFKWKDGKVVSAARHCAMMHLKI